MRRGIYALVLLSIMFVVFCDGRQMSQAVCTDTVCFSDDDTNSGYLEDKIRKEEDTYLGINFDTGSDGYGEYVEIGFKTEYVTR